ncbi:death-associated inhibitor of apoptosis 2 [Phlebotomus argentipes]|uniref:death-associated inhibitor of apoptosis 2 n=1 Tax=Phlebotomus argentipes TaxID=94469 RepID=UPI002892DE16|nr:death-associated inhibitor of apoptosis 2 [Phlebotomus argentipes]
MSDMKVEENRLRTFSRWPSDAPVSPERIAKAGFFATGSDLEVQCAWCEKKIAAWEYGDQVIARHRRLDPLCRFVINPTESGNVPRASGSSQATGVDDWKNEETRLRSFSRWPVTFVSPAALAKAGFYFFNLEDRVRCAWCQGVVGQWEEGDDPFTVHQRFFPTCPRAVLGPNIDIPAGERISELGIQATRPPKMPKYASLDARLRTFAAWPVAEVQRGEILAQAGFYYQGNQDQVRCFQCDGGLKCWLPDDDAWCEHAKWFPKCQFVQLMKGQAYIEAIQRSSASQKQESSARTGRPEPTMTLDEAMATEPVRQTLRMGLHEGRIRAATKQQLEHRGRPFDTADDLVRAVLGGQVFNEVDLDEVEPPEGSNVIVRRVSDIIGFLVNSTTHRMSTEAPPAAQEMAPPSSPDAPEVPKDAQSLEEENRKLKDARLCKICMDEEISIVFLPCAHLASCGQCASGVSHCPLCRSVINGRVRIFLS